MPNYALLKNSQVINVLVLEDDPSELQIEDDESLVAIPPDSDAGVGSTYEDGKFSTNRPEVLPVTISQVSRAQAKLALLAAGLLDDVERAIAGMTGDELRRATIEWNERATFERQSPFLLQMAATLGLDDEALDALFVDAAGR